MLILSLSQVRKIYYYYYYYYYIEEVELTFVISTKIEHLLLQANYLKVKYNKVTPTLPFQALFSRSKAFRLSGWCKCICGQGKVLRWLNNLRLPNSADQLDRPGISSSFNSATSRPLKQVRDTLIDECPIAFCSLVIEPVLLKMSIEPECLKE